MAHSEAQCPIARTSNVLYLSPSDELLHSLLCSSPVQSCIRQFITIITSLQITVLLPQFPFWQNLQLHALIKAFWHVQLWLYNKGHMGCLGFGTINTRPPNSCVSVLLAAFCDALRECCKTKACLSDLLGGLGILGWHRNTIALPTIDFCSIIIFHYF